MVSWLSSSTGSGVNNSIYYLQLAGMADGSMTCSTYTSSTTAYTGTSTLYPWYGYNPQAEALRLIERYNSAYNTRNDTIYYNGEAIVWDGEVAPPPTPLARGRPSYSPRHTIADRLAAQRRGREQELAKARRIWEARKEAERAARVAERLATQRAEEERRRQVEAARMRARMDAERVASTRARELLMDHLTEEQRDTFTRNGWFVVEGGKSKKRYKIHGNTYAGNVYLDDGSARFCCHCDYGIPLHDQLLAQKVMLEVAEENFLALANRTQLVAA